jgi:hypothetical protein
MNAIAEFHGYKPANILVLLIDLMGNLLQLLIVHQALGAILSYLTVMPSSSSSEKF